MSYSPWDTSGPSQIAREGNFYLPGVAVKKQERAKPKQAKTIDLKALKAYRDQRHTFKECAEKFGISTHVATKLLKDHPVKRGLKIQIDIAKALKLRSQGMPTDAIARAMGCSPRTMFERIGGASPEQKAAMLAKRTTGGKPHQITMTDAQYAEYQKRGGGKWLRKLLSKKAPAKKADSGCFFMEAADRDRAGAQA